MTTHPTPDLRVRRTLKALQNALIALMREKPYAAIQIKEITDRAEVSRPTFYLHFHAKEDLLLSLIDQLFEQFYREVAEATMAGAYTKLALCTELFRYWERHAEMLRLVVQADIQRHVVDRLRAYLLQTLTYLKAATGKPAADGPALDLMCGFMASGMYALMTQWGLQGLPYTAEQMGRFLHELTISHDDVTIESG